MTHLLLDQRLPRDHSAGDNWCRPEYRMAARIADLEGLAEAVSMADLLPAVKFPSYYFKSKEYAGAHLEVTKLNAICQGARPDSNLLADCCVHFPETAYVIIETQSGFRCRFHA